jgi:dihydrofolate reductase
MISLIVAMDKNRAIGKDNQLPWHLPEDLKNFKRLTTGHHMLMGRKTFDSIGRALPNRISLVLTRSPKQNQENLFYFSDINQAIDHAKAAGESELFIIGGANIYEQTLEMADRLYLTQVEAKVDGDAHFPEINFSQWREVETKSYPVTENNPYSWDFKILERV